MPLTLAQLLIPQTVDAWRSTLLAALQGLGIVVKSGTGAGGIGTGTGSITLSGVPVAAFPKIVINFVTLGELGIAQFQYSLDGGLTFSSTQTVPAVPGIFVLPGTGISITFVPGIGGTGTSFALSDQYIFALNTPSLPVTSWPSSSGYRQLVEIEAQALATFSAQQAAVAAGGFTPTATGAWADLLGTQFYNLARNSAAITAGQLTLSDPAGAGPFTISIGTMWFISSDGHRFFNTTGGTLPKNGSLIIQVTAESPGAAYNVANGTIVTIIAGILPGVTVDNSTNLINSSWITSQGSDAESDSGYMLRCQQRWPALGTGSTAAVYQLWATSAEQAAGHPTTITKVLAIADTVVPGQVDVYLAGTSGAVGGGAVTDAQNYINLRVPLTATAFIQAATNVVMTIAGTINFFQAKNSVSVVQAAVASALAAYVNALSMGSDSGGNVKVFYTELEAAVGSVLGGAGIAIRNLVSFTLNAGTSDIGLTTGQVAILSTPTSSLVFVGV